MAIFGKNGLEAAAMYLAILWAVYGQKDAGFADKAEFDKIEAIAFRKQYADSTGDKKAALLTLRTLRAQSLIAHAKKRPGIDLAATAKRYEGAEFRKGGTFEKEFVKKTFAR